MEIGRKIYFDIVTGDMIQVVGERSGDVIETTLEQDINTFKNLTDRIPDSFDFIQLEFGQFSQDFLECTSVRVNPETLELEFSYPDPNEPEAPPVFQKPLTEQISELNAKLATTQEAIDFLLMGGM